MAVDMFQFMLDSTVTAKGVGCSPVQRTQHCWICEPYDPWPYWFICYRCEERAGGWQPAFEIATITRYLKLRAWIRSETSPGT